LTLFQDLILFFDISDHPSLRFPEHIEPDFNAKPASLQEYDEKDFFGLGHNGKDYHLSGRIHALPPQQGIPGFQRVIMMKYLPNDDGSYTEECCWAYEGCVLPGCHIMLGRWWSPGDDAGDEMFSGPFIFWRVEERLEDKLKTVGTAVKFLEEKAKDYPGLLPI